jgi:alkylhydroperoxidase family enzyme
MVGRFDSLAEATKNAVLRGPGRTSPELRTAVARGEPPPELAALVDKIRRWAYRVTDEDLEALRSKYDEDQLFELVIAASVGAADERLRAGLKALEEA